MTQDRPRNVEDGDERVIRQLHAEGLSQTRTAERLGLDRPDLSRWSKRSGLRWGLAPEPATSVANEKMRAQRESLAAQCLTDAENMRERMWEPSVQLLVTRDGVERVTLDLPTPREVSEIAATVERLVKVSDHHSVGDTTANARSMLITLHQQIVEAVANTEEDE